ncbi:uncharacterized protein LOC122278598 [Carya illinoinensis]|uniref:uncharacterized protein LOC122278598 n=1 Tax=Carya illinoinensis TaxID=32201 RepID=UPI001C7191D5|nr:uncharacterized protein LOC122278598 [Carya illinoinensis]
MGGEDREVMERLACPFIPISSKPIKLITWSPLDRGRIKLNVDDGSCGNLGAAGGGGILRDYKGDVIGGFVHTYGHATNTIAECRAVYDGLWLCRQLNVWDVLVESDSVVIVGWLASGICKYWFLWNFWEEVKIMVRELNVRFRHIYREANMVADFLTKQGSQSLMSDFNDASSIHGRIRGSIRLDKIGLPYLRK